MEVQISWDFAVLEAEDCFNNSCGPRRRLEMAEIRFHSA